MGRGADVVEHAAWTVGFAGLADPAAVKDEQVGEEGAIFLGDHLQQALLYLFRISLPGETEPVREAPDVGVHDDALVYAEGVAQDHVGRLAADAGEGDELAHGARDLPAVFLEEGAGHPLQGAGLVAVEAGRADVFLQLAGIRPRVVCGGAVLLKEALCDLVHPDVGGLGGEHRRHQKLQGIGPVQLGTGVRVLPLEARYDRGDRGCAGSHGRIVWKIRRVRTMAGHYTVDYTFL